MPADDRTRFECLGDRGEFGHERPVVGGTIDVTKRGDFGTVVIADNEMVAMFRVSDVLSECLAHGLSSPGSYRNDRASRKQRLKATYDWGRQSVESSCRRAQRAIVIDDDGTNPCFR